MTIKMCSRRTIQDGEVVTFATDFSSPGVTACLGGFGYDALGSFEVSASRSGVTIHAVGCRSTDEIEAMIRALRLADAARQKLAGLVGYGASSMFPSEPTECEVEP